MQIDIPTGGLLVDEFDPRMRVVGCRYLGDSAVVRTRLKEEARQGPA